VNPRTKIALVLPVRNYRQSRKAKTVSFQTPVPSITLEQLQAIVNLLGTSQIEVGQVTLYDPHVDYAEIDGYAFKVRISEVQF
jgi:energy-converting hydrogenase Eha subunit A